MSHFRTYHPKGLAHLFASNEQLAAAATCGCYLTFMCERLSDSLIDPFRPVVVPLFHVGTDPDGNT